MNNLALNFNFANYGKIQSEPLSLEPNFKDSNYKLTSINYNFPTSNYPLQLYIPNTVKSIKTRAFFRVENVIMDIEFSDDIIIGESAFEKCTGLQSIKFNGNIKYLGEHCFHDCINLNSFSIMQVEEISNYAFSYCQNLKSQL